MASVLHTELDEISSIDNDDLLLVTINPSTTPDTRKITKSNFATTLFSLLQGTSGTGLDDVAFSGDYNDLTNTPTISTVGNTGSWNDLTDKPAELTGIEALTIDTAGQFIVATGVDTFEVQTPTEVRTTIGAQPLNSGLTEIAALAKTDGGVIVGDGTNFVLESGNTARTSLGLGTGNTPTFNGLSLTGDLTTTGNVDGRNIATDGTKLDGVESGADVTDAANVAAAGAIMDSNFSANGIMVRTASGSYTSRTLSNGTGVTIVNPDGVAGAPQVSIGQEVETTSTPSFAGLTVTADDAFGLSDGSNTIVFNMSSVSDGELLQRSGNTVIGTSAGAGSVTSVNITGSTGITPSGGPVTSSGSITLTLDQQLQDIASFGTPGADTFIVGDSSNLTLVSASAARTAMDVFSQAEVNTGLAGRVQKSGDTMTGSLIVGSASNTILSVVDAGSQSGNSADTTFGDVVIDSSGNAGIEFLGGASSQQRIGFSDSASYRGGFTYNHATDTLTGRAAGSDTFDVTTSGLQFRSGKSLGFNTGVSVTAILDEDDFASNSATALATQQSTRAFVLNNTSGQSVKKFDTVDDVLAENDTTFEVGEIVQVFGTFVKGDGGARFMIVSDDPSFYNNDDYTGMVCKNIPTSTGAKSTKALVSLDYYNESIVNVLWSGLVTIDTNSTIANTTTNRTARLNNFKALANSFKWINLAGRSGKIILPPDVFDVEPDIDNFTDSIIIADKRGQLIGHQPVFGITITSITSGATPTITTNIAHGRSVGQLIYLDGITSGPTELNEQVFQVASVPSSTTLTLSNCTASTSGAVGKIYEFKESIGSKAVSVSGRWSPEASRGTSIAVWNAKHLKFLFESLSSNHVVNDFTRFIAVGPNKLMSFNGMGAGPDRTRGGTSISSSNMDGNPATGSANGDWQGTWNLADNNGQFPSGTAGQWWTVVNTGVSALGTAEIGVGGPSQPLHVKAGQSIYCETTDSSNNSDNWDVIGFDPGAHGSYDKTLFGEIVHCHGEDSASVEAGTVDGSNNFNGHSNGGAFPTNTTNYRGYRITSTGSNTLGSGSGDRTTMDVREDDIIFYMGNLSGEGTDDGRNWVQYKGPSWLDITYEQPLARSAQAMAMDDVGYNVFRSAPSGATDNDANILQLMFEPVFGLFWNYGVSSMNVYGCDLHNGQNSPVGRLFNSAVGGNSFNIDGIARRQLPRGNAGHIIYQNNNFRHSAAAAFKGQDIYLLGNVFARNSHFSVPNVQMMIAGNQCNVERIRYEGVTGTGLTGPTTTDRGPLLDLNPATTVPSTKGEADIQVLDVSFKNNQILGFNCLVNANSTLKSVKVESTRLISDYNGTVAPVFVNSFTNTDLVIDVMPIDDDSSGNGPDSVYANNSGTWSPNEGNAATPLNSRRFVGKSVFNTITLEGEHNSARDVTAKSSGSVRSGLEGSASNVFNTTNFPGTNKLNYWHVPAAGKAGYLFDGTPETGDGFYVIHDTDGSNGLEVSFGALRDGVIRIGDQLFYHDSSGNLKTTDTTTANLDGIGATALDKDNVGTELATRGQNTFVGPQQINGGVLTVSNGINATGGFLKASGCFVNLGGNDNLTISSGAITPTKSYHTIDTEGGAATDTLSTINVDNAENGDILILRQSGNNRDITIDSSGNIHLPNNGSSIWGASANNNSVAMFLCDGSDWTLIGANSNPDSA